ncbi:MAG: hypothetical protein A2139_13860 [Desulfobacca sp. RBG_16_60_12]|nr:MAG: hypothetical protein A2139_13860 [Desulfobacca sp. RBG_16_60_12]
MQRQQFLARAQGAGEQVLQMPAASREGKILRQSRSRKDRIAARGWGIYQHHASFVILTGQPTKGLETFGWGTNQVRTHNRPWTRSTKYPDRNQNKFAISKGNLAIFFFKKRAMRGSEEAHCFKPRQWPWGGKAKGSEGLCGEGFCGSYFTPIFFPK